MRYRICGLSRSVTSTVVIAAKAGSSNFSSSKSGSLGPRVRASDGTQAYFVTTSLPFMIPEWPGKEQKKV